MRPPPEHDEAAEALAQAIAREFRARGRGFDRVELANQCLRELLEAQHNGLASLLIGKGVITFEELMQSETQAIRSQAEQRPADRFLFVPGDEAPESEDAAG